MARCETGAVLRIPAPAWLSLIGLVILRFLRSLREIKAFFCTQRPQRTQRFIPFRVSRLRWRVANFVTTRVRRGFYPPPPPVSGGESVTAEITAPANPLCLGSFLKLVENGKLQKNIWWGVPKKYLCYG